MAALTVASGTQKIASPVTLASNVSIAPAAGSQLTISGNIGETPSGQSLSLDGPGTLVLSGSNTYSGGTNVPTGTLIATSAAALPDGSALTVGAWPSANQPSTYQTVDSGVNNGPMSLGVASYSFNSAEMQWTFNLSETNTSTTATLQDVNFVEEFVFDYTNPADETAFTWNNAAHDWELPAKNWTITTYGVNGQNALMSMDRGTVDAPLSWTPAGGQTAVLATTDSVPTVPLGDFSPGQSKDFTLYIDATQSYVFDFYGFAVALRQAGTAANLATAAAGNPASQGMTLAVSQSVDLTAATPTTGAPACGSPAAFAVSASTGGASPAAGPASASSTTQGTVAGPLQPARSLNHPLASANAPAWFADLVFAQAEQDQANQKKNVHAVRDEVLLMMTR